MSAALNNFKGASEIIPKAPLIKKIIPQNYRLSSSISTDSASTAS